MFKKPMTFDDLEGNSVTQTFYFNYNKKEIAELMEFGHVLQFPLAPGETRLPLEEQMKALSTPPEESGLSQVENNKLAYKIFQDLILDAFGRKGADNVTFEKSPELRNYLASHVAFVDLIFEFLENPPLAAQFIEKCLPSKLVEQVKNEMEKEPANQGKTLAEMVEEAARRQQDPATRIEPGIDAAIQAGVATPEMAKVAQQFAEDGPVPVAPVEEPAPKKKPQDMTPEDIAAMSDEEFAKLNPQGLPQETMVAAFRRKSG